MGERGGPRGDGSDVGVVVLGLSFGFHDAAAAVLVDGRIVAAAEEERFTRIKHDPSLPLHATAACLELAGIGADDVDHVVFYEKPLAAAARFLATKQRQGPRSARSFIRDAPDILGRHLLCGYQVSRMLAELGARRPPPLQFVEHHLSHAASAFYPSPFESAAVLTVDGLGEWATATVGQGRHHQLSIAEELRFPDSLGLAYSLVTSWCGFRSNDDEYKVMGLAPYGTPRFVDALSELVGPVGDGSLRVDARRLDWWSNGRRSRRRVGQLLDGPPRAPDEPIGDREVDLAASIQALTETAVLDMARRAHARTGERRLCLAGGVALNCVANGRIQRDGPFDEIWVQPAAGDAGGALGAALAYWHLELDRTRAVTPGTDAMSGSFLGPTIDPSSIDEALARRGLEVPTLDADARAALVVDRLVAGDIVAVCDGPMEFGPRALGHRSLLADPRLPDVRRRLNVVTKGREEFRPFAPAVLAERADEWFELDVPSPYMLLVAPVSEKHLVPVDEEPVALDVRAGTARSTIPACTHVDGSARIQTVEKSANPQMHRLLAGFEERTGCPVLVNTSFNRAGEPIVASAEGAIASAAAGDVDLLVLGDRVLDRAALVGQDEPPPDPTAASASVPMRRGERLGIAWAAAAVPLTLQLHDLGILDPFGMVANAAFALALLVAWARRTALTSAVAVALLVVDLAASANGERRFVAMQVLMVLLSAVATGWVPLRRPRRRAVIAGPSVLFAAPLITADVLLVVRPGLAVPAALAALGIIMAVLAVWSGPRWIRLEHATGGATRWVASSLRRLQHVVAVVFRSLATALSWVVTSLVFVVVVVLPWALQRLTFSDPLWAPRSSGSRWIGREVRPDLRTGDLWLLDPAPRQRIAVHRRRRVAAMVAAVAVVTGIVVVIRSSGHRAMTTQEAVLAADDHRDKGTVVRDLQAEPWFDEWNASYQELWDKGTMSQFAGTEFGDVAGRYLTWTDGVRRSWAPDDAPCRPTLDVWMLGGSAGFGTGQRDEHTLASELARIAWEDGYRLRIQNRAIPGDVAWVEQRRLELALASGVTAPDLVVFYDGFNDVRASRWAYEAGFDVEGRLLALTDRDLVPVLGHLVEEERDGRRVVVADAVDINARPVESDEDVATVVDAAAFQYRTADDLSRRFLEDRGIAVARFFQPNVDTRDPAVGDDFPGTDVGRRLMDQMRRDLPPGTVDLGDVFDDDSRPYFADDVHTDEAANVPLAESMWRSLRRTASEIARPAGSSCS